jgi:hypothetical protein
LRENLVNLRKDLSEVSVKGGIKRGGNQENAPFARWEDTLNTNEVTTTSHAFSCVDETKQAEYGNKVSDLGGDGRVHGKI